MSSDEIKVAPGPSVVIQRIEKIQTYEVLAQDLDSLDELVSSENQALAFTTASGGIAIPTIVSWAVAVDPSPRATAVYITISGLALLAMFWFLVTWLRVRRARPRLLQKIRGQGEPRLLSMGEGTPISSRDAGDLRIE